MLTLASIRSERIVMIIPGQYALGFRRSPSIDLPEAPSQPTLPQLDIVKLSPDQAPRISILAVRGIAGWVALSAGMTKLECRHGRPQPKLRGNCGLYKEKNSLWQFMHVTDV